jgi:hypothetical protein
MQYIKLFYSSIMMIWENVKNYKGFYKINLIRIFFKNLKILYYDKKLPYVILSYLKNWGFGVYNRLDSLL